ncbi:MAG: putative toxin-antitoxin system toxin component, PIN family [Planctomycetes bacterium]|nr:putative toxin-antitoxin system toxin component, PIN family [Planctomycetota bacterium]
MKCVIDTNVLVSATMTRGGTCDQVLRLVADGAVEAFVDRRMFDEYERVLAQPEFRFDADAIAETLDVFRATAKLVSPEPIPARLPHPSDLPFLEAASEAKAVLVTGNKRHFPAHARMGVVVVSPAEFLELLRRG